MRIAFRRAVLLGSLAFLGLITTGLADVVELKSGRRLEGEIVKESADAIEIKTRFGTQSIARSDIASVDKGDTPEVALGKDIAALEDSDAEGHYQAALRANKLGQRKQYQQLLERAAEIDPQHVEANEALGRVLYKGRFVAPLERDRLEQESRAAEMLAQGLVEFQGRFVTPEEKVNLDQGLVLRNGEWVDQDEAQRRDGFVRVDGRWIRGEDHAADELRTEASRVTGTPLILVKTAHIAVYSDIGQEFAEKLAKLMEKGYVSFTREFQTGQSLEWLGGQRVDLFAFKVRFAYQKFVDYLGQDLGMGAAWAGRARKVVSIYRVNPHGLAATYMANKGQKFTAAHCANMLGHVLINRYRNEGQMLPPFFDEAFAALMEFDLLGRNVVFSLGSGRYDRTIQADDNLFFEDGKWAEALRQAMRSLSDTPLDQAVRRDHGQLLQLDIAKGMALLMRWRAMGEQHTKGFFDGLREAWPGGELPSTHALVLQAISKGFHAVEQKDIAVVDQELRKFTMNKLK